MYSRHTESIVELIQEGKLSPIFEPAGMADTGFYSLYDDVSNLALGYTNHIISPIPGETDESTKDSRKVAPHPEPGTSAGGVYSTAADMLRFSKALQNDKLIDAEHIEKANINQYRYLPVKVKARL